MHSPVIKYISYFTFVFGFLGILGAFILLRFFPAYYFVSYPIIPALFYLFGLGHLLLIKHLRKVSQKSALQWVMIWRVARFLLLMVIVLLFLLLAQLHKLSFVLVFLVFYFSYLVLESWSYYAFGLAKNIDEK